MDNPYRIRLRDDGKWETCRPGCPDMSFPESIGTERKAFACMARMNGVTPHALRKAAKDGTLNPVVM